MRIVSSVLMALTVMLLSACSDTEVSTDSHVWTDQVESIERANEVEETLRKAASVQLSSLHNDVD